MRKRIIVTRPQHQAGPLIAAFEKKGFEVIAFPTIAIEWVEADSPVVASDDTLIFTSVNAVDAWRGGFQCRHVLAVGPATCEALRARGAAPIMPGEAHCSEGLLALPALQANRVRDQRTVIVTGEGGRSLLKTELRARGAHVTEVCLYRRCIPEVDVQAALSLWKEKTIDMIAVTSLSALENLWAMVAPLDEAWLTQQTLLVSSERARRRAAELGFCCTRSLIS